MSVGWQVLPPPGAANATAVPEVVLSGMRNSRYLKQLHAGCG